MTTLDTLATTLQVGPASVARFASMWDRYGRSIGMTQAQVLAISAGLYSAGAGITLAGPLVQLLADARRDICGASVFSEWKEPNPEPWEQALGRPALHLRELLIRSPARFVLLVAAHTNTRRMEAARQDRPVEPDLVPGRKLTSQGRQLLVTLANAYPVLEKALEWVEVNA